MPSCLPVMPSLHSGEAAIHTQLWNKVCQMLQGYACAWVHVCFCLGGSLCMCCTACMYVCIRWHLPLFCHRVPSCVAAYILYYWLHFSPSDSVTGVLPLPPRLSLRSHGCVCRRGTKLISTESGSSNAVSFPVKYVECFSPASLHPCVPPSLPPSLQSFTTQLARRHFH